MKITKDEAYILYRAMENYKFEKSDHNMDLFNAYTDLQQRLNHASDDKRRKGRTSMNSSSDLIKRFINVYKNN